VAALWDGFNTRECEAELSHLQSGRRVLSFEAVAARALASAGSIVPAMLPGGKRIGGEWVSRNPTRADLHAGSFSVNLQSGKWSDFATGDSGGDLIALAAYLDGCTQWESCQRLGAALGI